MIKQFLYISVPGYMARVVECLSLYHFILFVYFLTQAFLLPLLSTPSLKGIQEIPEVVKQSKTLGHLCSVHICGGYILQKGLYFSYKGLDSAFGSKTELFCSSIGKLIIYSSSWQIQSIINLKESTRKYRFCRYSLLYSWAEPGIWSQRKKRVLQFISSQTSE